MYNRYVIYKDKILCDVCNNARLTKEAARIKELRAVRKAKREAAVKPSKKAKKAAKGQELDLMTVDDNPEYTKEDVENEEGKTAENSR